MTLRQHVDDRRFLRHRDAQLLPGVVQELIDAVNDRHRQDIDHDRQRNAGACQNRAAGITREIATKVEQAECHSR
jgi:hypothetical protein